jgi:DNA-binding beta-propeller fold protein YncE
MSSKPLLTNTVRIVETRGAFLGGNRECLGDKCQKRFEISPAHAVGIAGLPVDQSACQRYSSANCTERKLRFMTIEKQESHNSPPRDQQGISPVGFGGFTYSAHDDWEKRPAEFEWIEVSAVAIDSQDRVYVFNRGTCPVIVFDRDGSVLDSWGAGKFARAHGITIGPDDAVYCVDDLDHTVSKYTRDGQLLLKLGTSGQPSDTGATSIDFRTIRYAGPPFYFPTNLALSLEGEIYVADGYGNACIHKFAPDGRLLLSWGSPGVGPGEFRVPHGIAVDTVGNIFVADRENCRIQVFSPQGEFLSEMTDIARPCQVSFDASGNLYVAELGFRAGIWPGTPAPPPDATGGRISIFSSRGELLSRWGGGNNPTSPGDFFAPHDICIDSRGDVYVAEVVMSAGGNRGLVSATCHTLQKFVRQ